ncbi:MAG: galactose-1-phosphate uridylyltransferase, partial [Candidatus Methylomirabilales bacterium]
MPELRQDPTTKEWVVIAVERARRPEQFRQRTEFEPPGTEQERLCPFCPGNEPLTPGEIVALRDSGSKDQPGWRVRVVPNKFAALTPEESTQRHDYGRFFHSLDGYGHHEVIIESPQHNTALPLMREQQILELLYVYCQRYDALRKDPRVKLILLFRNHGRRAGTSLVHPHSQLIATPIIPFHIREKYEVAIRHYDDTGHCLYCDVVAEEKAVGSRVVLETPRLLVFHPFASQVPFETWIAPKGHNPCFARLSLEEKGELATVLRQTLRGLYDSLENPDFNLIVHTAPVEDEDKPYFLWHIEIRPRLTTAAGFELGTGIYINTAIP